MSPPEVKYAKEKEYAGNCPFLRHNQQEYLEKKEKEDALRKKEETTEKVS